MPPRRRGHGPSGPFRRVIGTYSPAARSADQAASVPDAAATAAFSDAALTRRQGGRAWAVSNPEPARLPPAELAAMLLTTASQLQQLARDVVIPRGGPGPLRSPGSGSCVCAPPASRWMGPT